MLKKLLTDRKESSMRTQSYSLGNTQKINARQKTGHIDRHDNREPLISMATDGARVVVSIVTR